MSTIHEDLHSLKGPDKAAVFLLALGEGQASKLFQLMDHEEIRSLSQHMAHLGSVSAAVVEQLLVEFSQQVSSTGSLVGTLESTERLLSRSLEPDRVRQIMEEIRGPSGRTMWDKLGNVNETVLANYLVNEYPQTIAVVLTKIKPAHAARVLSLFPENLAIEVIVRMLRTESVQKEILDHVERTLRTEFMTNLARTSRRDSHEHMAEIFNSLDRATESRLMATLEECSHESAERIKQLMFTFEDLIRVDASGIQLLLRQIQKEQLAIALKGASEQVRAVFLSNMSERAGKMLQEDIAALGPIRIRDVDEAQSAIVATAKMLADANEITIVASNEPDQLVY